MARTCEYVYDLKGEGEVRTVSNKVTLKIGSPAWAVQVGPV